MVTDMDKITQTRRSGIILIVCTILFAVAPSYTLGQDFSVEASMERGEEVYVTNCAACHRKNGKGLLGTPPLANSDYLLADTARAIRIIRNGMEQEILVNGKTYKNAMLPVELTDEETADVMNYILNSWGNTGETVTAEQVSEVLVSEN